MIYIIIAITVCISIWWLLQKLSPQHKKLALTIIIVGSLFLLAFLLIRISPYAAAIVGGLTTVAIVIRRIMTAWSYYRWFQNIWPSKNKPTPPAPSTNMTITEAADILGIPTDASKKDIIKAHKHLIKRNHPDSGGTTKLAEHINLAKDTLLKHREHDKN